MRYMKINGRALNPRQAYNSAWVGNRTGGSESTLNGNSAPVLGVFGGKDDDHIQSLGLLVMSRP